jgi:uncharacterized protein YcbX
LISGRVTELHRWPVKSFAGEPVSSFLLDERGVAGDRTHALFDTFKDAPRRLTVRQVARMLAWRADYEGDETITPDAPPMARVTAPDGTVFTWDDVALPAALSDDLGRDVALRRDVSGQQDLARSVLLTTAATLATVSAELGMALDLRRFRTNIHLELDAPAFSEEQWEGEQIQIGETTFDLLHPCVRCVIPTRDPDTTEKTPVILRHLAREHGTLFGINARARGTGRIAAGDPARLSI